MSKLVDFMFIIRFLERFWSNKKYQNIEIRRRLGGAMRKNLFTKKIQKWYLEQNNEIKQSWTGPKILTSAFRKCLATMSKVFFLDGRLGTRFYLHATLRSSYYFLVPSELKSSTYSRGNWFCFTGLDLNLY